MILIESHLHADLDGVLCPRVDREEMVEVDQVGHEQEQQGMEGGGGDGTVDHGAVSGQEGAVLVRVEKDQPEWKTNA